jgi:hypothetical protein
MIVKKIWSLYKPDADYTDTTFIYGLNCDIEVDIPELLELTHNGKTYEFANGFPKIAITTTCEQQEMMLKLKYGDDLIIKQIIHTKLNPHSEAESQ